MSRDACECHVLCSHCISRVLTLWASRLGLSVDQMQFVDYAYEPAMPNMHHPYAMMPAEPMYYQVQHQPMTDFGEYSDFNEEPPLLYAPEEVSSHPVNSLRVPTLA